MCSSGSRAFPEASTLDQHVRVMWARRVRETEDDPA